MLPGRNQTVIVIKEAHDNPSSVNFIKSFIKGMLGQQIDLPVYFLLERDKERLAILEQERDLGGLSIQSIDGLEFKPEAIKAIGKERLNTVYSYLSAVKNKKGWVENRKGLLSILGMQKVQPLPIDASWEDILKYVDKALNQTPSSSIDIHKYQRLSLLQGNLKKLLDKFQRTKDPKLKHQIAPHDLLMPYRDSHLLNETQQILATKGDGVYIILTGAKHSHPFEQGIKGAFIFDRSHNDPLTAPEKEVLMTAIKRIKGHASMHTEVATSPSSTRIPPSLVRPPVLSHRAERLTSSALERAENPILGFISQNRIAFGIGTIALGFLALLGDHSKVRAEKF